MFMEPTKNCPLGQLFHILIIKLQLRSGREIETMSICFQISNCILRYEVEYVAGGRSKPIQAELVDS